MSDTSRQRRLNVRRTSGVARATRQRSLQRHPALKGRAKFERRSAADRGTGFKKFSYGAKQDYPRAARGAVEL
jgi:hypothetical protein